jgi:hypothetical protein
MIWSLCINQGKKGEFLECLSIGAPMGGIIVLVRIWKFRMMWALCINKEKKKVFLECPSIGAPRPSDHEAHIQTNGISAYNEFWLQMKLPKSMIDLPEFTWGRGCRVVLRSNRGYRDGNWFSGTKNYTIMYKVDKSWFGFLSRPEIESRIYSHLLWTWWYE